MGVEEFPGAPVGKKALLQRATKNEFNAIVAPAGPFTDVDVSVKFDPLSGKEDASAASCFGFRVTNTTLSEPMPSKGISGCTPTTADAVNWRAPASSPPPSASGICSESLPSVTTSRVGSTAPCYSDYRDSRFKSGRVGLWTKADSITAFNDFTIRGGREAPDCSSH